MNEVTNDANPLNASSQSSTSLTLLERVKSGEQVAWERFVQLYSPMVYSKCRRAGFGEEDAADITQNVFQKVFGSLHTFRRDREGLRFRKWFATVVRSVTVDFVRVKTRQIDAAGGSVMHEVLQNQADVLDDESLSAQDGDMVLVMRQALEMIKGDFEERTWQAFLLVTVENRSASEVGEQLGMEANAVRQAKYRVYQRLKEEFAGLLG